MDDFERFLIKTVLIIIAIAIVCWLVKLGLYALAVQ